MNRLNEAAAESDLQRALDCGELIRLYQPIVELESRAPAYVEVPTDGAFISQGATRTVLNAPVVAKPYGRLLTDANRVIVRDRSGAPRRGVAACASRTPDHGVGQSVGGAPGEA